MGKKGKAGPLSARLSVKVVPKSSRDRVVGWLGEALKVAVSAPPERGRANDALCAVLADALAVPAAHVRVVAGHGAPRKVVEIDGMDEAEARRRITAVLGG